MFEEYRTKIENLKTQFEKKHQVVELNKRKGESKIDYLNTLFDTLKKDSINQSLKCSRLTSENEIFKELSEKLNNLNKNNQKQLKEKILELEDLKEKNENLAKSLKNSQVLKKKIKK